MAIVERYDAFEGTHWETGSVQNYYAARGVTAPHTGEPYSEALLLGVSGGIVMGYFTFLYEGYDPQCNILTRNTFDPMTTMLARLGVVQEVAHTASAARAVELLVDRLESGTPAIVWADMWSLPYNALDHGAGMWGMYPIVVYGYDPGRAEVLIADRSQVPLKVSTAQLAAARGRVKKEKHRLMTLDVPNPEKLRSAVLLGIGDCIRLFTETPPRGSKNNFGLQAYRNWARMLEEPRHRASWAKQFPPGIGMWAGLTSAYNFAFLFGKGLDQDGERGRYADFLDEAGQLLDNPGFGEVASLFRASAALWHALPGVMLPEEVAPFREARELMWRRHERFLRAGGAALEEMRQIDSKLAALRQSMTDDFPLEEQEVVALRGRIAAHLLEIHDAEETAIRALREAMV